MGWQFANKEKSLSMKEFFSHELSDMGTVISCDTRKDKVSLVINGKKNNLKLSIRTVYCQTPVRKDLDWGTFGYQIIKSEKIKK